MAEMEERELLLASLRGYLEELLETGVTELPFAPRQVTAAAPEPAAHPCEPPPGVGAPPAGEPAAQLRSVGDPAARLVFVMAGAGFEGEAGDLLVKIVQAMGFRRDEVLLLSFDARDLPSRPALVAAILEGHPEAVVALGEGAARILLETDTPLSQLRGTFAALERAALMPTWHPEELVKDAGLKREVWNDMQQVMRLLGKERG